MNFKKFISNQSGFSLIEIAIVLAIIGIIIAGVLRGHDLFENAQLKSIPAQIDQFRCATYSFYNTFGKYPHDYNQSHITTIEDPKNINTIFWKNLKDNQLLNFKQESPESRLGGQYTVIVNQDNFEGVWFCLGQKKDTSLNRLLLTPQQALTIMTQNDNDDPFSGRIQVREGSNSDDKCLIENKINLKCKKPACILYFQL